MRSAVVGLPRRTPTVTLERTGGRGPTGPPGPPGTGDLNYVHTQGVPAATWTVQHNLGKWPSVTVIDTANNHLLTDVHFVDDNTLVVSLAYPTSGKALVN